MRIGIDGITKVNSLPESIESPDGNRPVIPRVPLQLDLRGKRADEVEPNLDSYLNDAVQSNLTKVRIIHGIGTGAVRAIVRDFLSTHPLVKSFRPGERDEGGDGATIVNL